jgi:hypothetical protein
MIVLLSCEDNASPARTEESRQFQPRHPIYLVCSDTFGEILYFVQDGRSFVAGDA